MGAPNINKSAKKSYFISLLIIGGLSAGLGT